MKMPMFLSVVIPCYNVGAPIVDLLAAITAQLGSDCELVLINDGSTDDTQALIDNFASRYTGAANLQIRHTSNAGAAAARTLGLSLASGEYVFFCDSDDVMHDNFVATLRQCQSRKPELDLLLFTSDMAVEKKGSLVHSRFKVRYEQEHDFSNGAQLLEFNLVQQIYTAAVWTYVARRALVLQAESAFTARKAHEDHLFTLKIYLNAEVVLAIPQLLYTQRIRSGSLTNSAKDAAYILDRISASNEARDLLVEKKFRRVALYDAWTFQSVQILLRENKRLLFSVLKNAEALRYLRLNLTSMKKLVMRRLSK